MAWLLRERGNARIEQLLWMKSTTFDLPKGLQHGETRVPAMPTMAKSRSAEQHRREDSGGAA
jgi:hypothetical protein